MRSGENMFFDESHMLLASSSGSVFLSGTWEDALLRWGVEEAVSWDVE